MNILITGNQGYVGSELVKYLRKKYPLYKIAGLDIGLFSSNLTTNGPSPDSYLDLQHYCDIRKIKESFFKNIDSVIHLAAISNDPIGKKFEKITHDINYLASKKLFNYCKSMGVSKFVFASSCSMYGSFSTKPKKENDTLNPLTAYAKSKVAFEKFLSKNKSITKTLSLRFATACGMSDRLRLDLVLNDFVTNALTNKLIDIHSDGTPWRPLIDVHDMCRAFDWAIHTNNKSIAKNFAVNVGKNSSNYKIKDLAFAVAKKIPNTKIKINKNAMPDKRSYSVDFSLFEKLAKNYIPEYKLDKSINNLIEGINKISLSKINIQESKFIRLNTLNNYIKNRNLSKNLEWKIK